MVGLGWAWHHHRLDLIWHLRSRSILVMLHVKDEVWVWSCLSYSSCQRMILRLESCLIGKRGGVGQRWCLRNVQIIWTLRMIHRNMDWAVIVWLYCCDERRLLNDSLCWSERVHWVDVWASIKLVMTWLDWTNNLRHKLWAWYGLATWANVVAISFVGNRLVLIWRRCQNFIYLAKRLHVIIVALCWMESKSWLLDMYSLRRCVATWTSSSSFWASFVWWSTFGSFLRFWPLSLCMLPTDSIDRLPRWHRLIRCCNFTQLMVSDTGSLINSWAKSNPRIRIDESIITISGLLSMPDALRLIQLRNRHLFLWLFATRLPWPLPWAPLLSLPLFNQGKLLHLLFDLTELLPLSKVRFKQLELILEASKLA